MRITSTRVLIWLRALLRILLRLSSRVSLISTDSADLSRSFLLSLHLMGMTWLRIFRMTVSGVRCSRGFRFRWVHKTEIYNRGFRLLPGIITRRLTGLQILWLMGKKHLKILLWTGYLLRLLRGLIGMVKKYSINIKPMLMVKSTVIPRVLRGAIMQRFLFWG